MTNKEVSAVFKSIADLLQLQGADPFRVRSYQRVVDLIRGLTEDLEAIHARGELRRLPGVGETIAQKIAELLETGRIEFHQRLLNDIPPGLVTLLEVPELGPKTVKKLYDELGLATVEEVEEAARQQRLRGLKGFGERSEEKLLHNIGVWRRGRERVLAATALAAAEPLLAALAEAVGVEQVSLAGSLRRGRDTTKDIDLLVAATEPTAAIETFLAQTGVVEVTGRGETKASVRLCGGLNADLRVVPPASWGAALQYFTGSKAHNIALRARARERGLSLNEYGLSRLDESASIEPVATEAALYAAVGLPWIPPELREDRGELAAAEAGALPELIERADYRGDLHAHTNWSDGHDSITAMAHYARDLGYEYLAITDHSQILTIARGLDERRVRQQWAEIAEAQEQVPEVRLLRGIEVDILADGRLDLDLDLLAELDIVVASVHSAFGQDEATMTRRLLAALATGVVDILGHPTGRLLDRREGFNFAVDEVFAAAVEGGVALEINAAPQRLDLDEVLARRAALGGALIAVNCDAHHGDQFGFLRYGLAQARRAWLTPAQVLNTRSLSELLQWLKDG